MSSPRPRSRRPAASRPGLLLAAGERDLAAAISRLTFCNPFTRERLELERQVLGEGFIPFDVVWHAQIEPAGDNPNLPAITETVQALAERLRARLLAEPRTAAAADELELYRDLVLYLLYNRYQGHFLDAIQRQEGAPEMARGTASRPRGEAAEGRISFAFYRRFADDLGYFLDLSRAGLAAPDPGHLFACFFQIRRAFQFTLRSIVGGSPPAARLREQIWQSIFTHDLRRYQRSLYGRIGDVTTLVTGASGTGKEVVARAIGHSRYLPFDAASLTFRESWIASFFPLNLSALAPTLVESELFGHCRGAFTGAVADRAGWLELCPSVGTVFLDEIGETDTAIQVKLLRVLETRTFERLGETRERTFQGKVIAATNRDLADDLHTGRFRADLYYRLCSDILTTPTLAERIAAAPEELSNLVLHLSRRAAGDELAAEVAREVEGWIAKHLGTGYPWPGNVRELAQCVNNVLIRRDYRPASRAAPAPEPRARLAAEILEGKLAAEEVLRRYCTLVFAAAGSYEEAGRRLGLDRRTVRSRVDFSLLAELRRHGP
jgi:transcriptional regulator with AAA-type ATPase domain